MADINGLKTRLNEIGTEVDWHVDEGLQVIGVFMITDVAYMNLDALNELGMSYVGDEYPKISAKYYDINKEYKFEYQSTDFLRINI